MCRLGSADTKSVFSDQLKVELKLYMHAAKEKTTGEGDTKMAEGGKKAAAPTLSSKEAFSSLTDEQKTELKEHLQANGAPLAAGC